MNDAALKAGLLRRLVELGGLIEFVRAFWHVVEPCEYLETWHILEDCKALEAVAREYRCVECGHLSTTGVPRSCPECGARRFKREHNRVVFNQPPGTMKSLLVNVFWPCWVWTFEPSHRWMFTSYGDGVVLRDSERALRILKSDLYRACWPEVELVGGVTGKQAVGNFETTRGGTRYSFSLRGGILGWHTDTLVIDDPLKPEQAEAPSRVDLEAVEYIYRNKLRTRRRDPILFAEVLIMQRLADDDLSGVFLDEFSAEHVCWPMSYVPDCPWDRGNRFGLEDPRTQEGELLWPERFTAEVVEADMGVFSPQTAAAQYQQNPSPKTGVFFEAEWFKEYAELPPLWTLEFLQSWDLGFKGRDPAKRRLAVEARSWVHGALWALHRQIRHCYLVAERRGKWNYAETKRVFVTTQLDALWARSSVALVEDKANGPALISELQVLVPIIKAWNPEGSKEDRARRQSARIENGVLHLPKTSWAEEFRAELVRFPRGKANDRVDTTTMLLDFLYSPGAGYAEQLRRLAKKLAAGG